MVAALMALALKMEWIMNNCWSIEKTGLLRRRNRNLSNLPLWPLNILKKTIRIHNYVNKDITKPQHLSRDNLCISRTLLEQNKFRRQYWNLEHSSLVLNSQAGRLIKLSFRLMIQLTAMLSLTTAEDSKCSLWYQLEITSIVELDMSLNRRRL